MISDAVLKGKNFKKASAVNGKIKTFRQMIAYIIFDKIGFMFQSGDFTSGFFKSRPIPLTFSICDCKGVNGDLPNKLRIVYILNPLLKKVTIP
jgi:hypothetical protein